jgi:hypothetical protein
MPGPPGGIGGGIAGRPGIPEIPRPPDFPRPPIGPGIGRRPGIGGLPGGPAIYDWSCSGCGRHLGTGANPPPIRICPGCGARLEGARIIDGPGAGPGGGPFPPVNPPVPPVSPPPPVAPVAPGADNPQPLDPGLGAVNALIPPAMNNAQPPAFEGGVYVPPSRSSSTNSRASTARILLIVMGILVLLGIGMAGVVVAILKTQKPARRPAHRSRRRFDDDY